MISFFIFTMASGALLTSIRVVGCSRGATYNVRGRKRPLPQARKPTPPPRGGVKSLVEPARMAITVLLIGF